MKNIIVIFGALLVILFISIVLKQLNCVEKKYYIEEYIIHDGDVIWNIAEVKKPKNMDIRKYIYDIEEDNNINSGYIYPGMIIKLRIYEE